MERDVVTKCKPVTHLVIDKKLARARQLFACWRRSLRRAAAKVAAHAKKCPKQARVDRHVASPNNTASYKIIKICMGAISTLFEKTYGYLSTNEYLQS